MDAQSIDKTFTEKVSGKNTDRPQLKAMMSYIREGDVVVVESISRLARSTRDLLTIVEQLDSKGVQFVSLKENIDTATPQGRFMLTVFGAMAQLEREQTLQRQREGIAVAKAEGKYKGRAPIAVDDAAFRREVEAWQSGKQTATETMRRLNLKPNTFYRRVKQLDSHQ